MDVKFLLVISFKLCLIWVSGCSPLANVIFVRISIAPQDEVRDPRQVLARPTWVADRGSGATVHNGVEKIWVAPSVWPMAILVCSVWRIPIFRSGQYPNFGLFGLANTQILVCSVWPILIFWSVRSGRYPYFGLFGLANTQISACSVWPIPKFWSVRSGQYSYFGLFGLANTHISVWPIPIFLSVRSGQYPYFGLFGLANTNFQGLEVQPNKSQIV